MIIWPWEDLRVCGLSVKAASEAIRSSGFSWLLLWEMLTVVALPLNWIIRYRVAYRYSIILSISWWCLSDGLSINSANLAIGLAISGLVMTAT